jgi:hypothetical protein
LAGRGGDCLSCVESNGCFDPTNLGGTCEDTTGTAPAACGAAIGGAASVSETAVCISTLKQIFTSMCAATQQLTPCLCGSADAAACLAGTAAPNGPLLPIYQCELGTTGPQISAAFLNQATGAGQANSIAQCAGAFGCSCF